MIEGIMKDRHTQEFVFDRANFDAVKQELEQMSQNIEKYYKEL